jgi:serine/threonine kinase 32
VATTTPANTAEHARQFSQPNPNGNQHLTQTDGAYRAPSSQQINTVNENLNPNDPAHGAQPPSPSNRVSPSPPPAPSFHRPLPQNYRPRGAARQMSKSGGVQMVLNEAGSWSELAHTSTLPAEGLEGGDDKSKQANGMMSFFSRKKGRDRSPKPTEPGVLGKEGARQIIN